jgi:N-acetylglucosaminyldiphosphoundecaprenol N-acetyl-beta-D-mannosaminyltransferase
VQRAGLEWVHRLAHEPRRLFRRYVVEGIPFALRLLVYAALSRVLAGLTTRPDRIVPKRRRA